MRVVSLPYLYHRYHMTHQVSSTLVIFHPVRFQMHQVLIVQNLDLPLAPPPAPLDAADVPEDVEEEDELELHVPNPVKCFVQTTKSEPTLILHSFAPEGTPETLSEVQVAVISVTVFVLWKKPTCVPVCPANKRRTGWLNVSDSDEPTVITSCGAATCPAATGKFRLSEL